MKQTTISIREAQLWHTEKEFMAWIIRLASVSGWAVYHVFDSRRSAFGWPDLVLVNDRVLFREVKMETGKLTLGQQNWIAMLKAAGADAAVWRPSDHEEIIEALTARRGEE